MKDLTAIYYTSNYLDTHNPYFLENTKKQLLIALDGLPLISVSQKPIAFGKNICIGDIGRSHLNLYKQILIGCKAATTKYVAMAEDDILYSHEHFHYHLPEGDVFSYNMAKWSLFTWSRPPVFSFRNKRKVVNSLIAPRQMLVDALEERFKKVEELKALGKKEENIIHYWGDPGRYEDKLGVTVRPTEEFFTTETNIVFSHPEAFGYLSRGTRKRLGDIRAYEIPYWGRASDILRLYNKDINIYEKQG